MNKCVDRRVSGWLCKRMAVDGEGWLCERMALDGEMAGQSDRQVNGYKVIGGLIVR